MDRLIIRGDAAAPYQHLYIYKNGDRIDSFGVLFEDLAEAAINCLEKYELDHIDLSGSRFYMEGIEKAIKDAYICKYSTMTIIFRYV
jgi:hypothetical protein